MTSQTVEGFHLSPQQKRLWTIHRGSELAYRAQCAVEVRGAVDTSLLRTAVEDVVRRHELLRTRLVLLPGMAFPLQSISDDVDFVGEADDCSAGAAPSPDSVWQEMATLHFDMSRGPALHYSIVTTAPDTHLFALCLPALHVDRTGLESLVVEIWRTYAGLDAGSPSSGTPIQYADLSEWLNDLLSSDERAAGRGYWAKQESQCAAPLPLPLEHPADGPFNPASHACEIDSRLIAKIEAVAGQGEGALEAFLLAAWQCLIARLTSAGRVTVGLGCDGRRHEELKNAIGLFTRYVPLSGEIGDDTPFAEILGQTAAASRDARLWQEYFDPARLRDAHADAMGRDTGANRGLTPNPRGQTPAWGLTPVLLGSDPGLNPGQPPTDPTTAAIGFEYHDRPAVFSAGDLSFSFRKVSACVDRFRMLLSCSRAGGGVEASFVYDAHAFAQSAVHALAKQYLTLLECAASDPATAVARLSVLAEDERRRLIVGLNRTQRDYPGDRCLHQRFEAQAARTPDAVAVVHEERRLTYSELNSRANRLARTLRKHGAGPEVLVGVCLERSPEMIVSLLAIAKSGAAYVPLDPAYPQERLGLMVEDSGMPLLVTQTSLAPRFCAFGVRVVSVDADSATVAAEADHDLDSNVTPENLAYVIYTSGSTGKPKGVLIEHRSLVNYLDWSIEAYDVAGGAGAPVHSSISFDATITSVFPALLVGRPIVLVPEGEEIEGLGRLLRSDTGFSLIKITPAHLDLLSQMLGPEPVSGTPAFFVIGGEALFGKSVQYWKQHAPQSRLVNEYGPTETVVGCCVYEIPADREIPPSIPIGRPIANTRIYVLDRHLQPVPVGVPGEIYIGGAGVARGYLNRPALTDERFIADPFDPHGGRVYRTGDLARYLPDDNLEYLGRADEQIKLHGFRIEPGEVESAMTGYPGITEAVVLADADAAGTARLVAFFVAHDTPIDPNALRAFLEERLPKYMVPTLYVGVSALPLTPNGKVNRKALLQSDSLKGRSRAEYVAPKNPEEEMLARIWADVLKVEQVGAEDNFFDLGGDSIRSIQILARLKQAGFEVSLQQLFQYQTVAQMARVIPAARAGAAEALPQIEPYALLAAHDRAKLPEGVADAYPASALQLGMLFYSAYHPGDSLYVDIDTMHLRAPLDAGRLRETLDVLARRHEALRTSFDTRAYSEPLQLVHGAACIPLEIDDIRSLPQAEQEARVHAWVAEQRTRGFAWDTAPLLRFHVFMRSDESFQLGFSRHHAILDGWSAAALLTEMVQQYLGLCGKDVAPLPEAPRARYRDFVAMERRVAASPEARRYWTTKLADVPVTALPRWKHAQPVQVDAPTRTRRLGRLDIELSAGLSEDLARAAQQTRTTLKSVLLAAHMKVMSVLGSSDDIVTGLVSNGRIEEHDGERVLGLFLNTVPFRLQLAGGTWSDLVRSVFEAECELLPFRRYPMAEIQRARGGQALFEVLFNFIHFHVYDGIARTPDVEILEATAYEQTNFTLLVSFSRAPSSQAVTLSLYYDAVELEDEQMRVLAEYYRDTLTSISREPDARYERHSVLTAPERRQLLVEWNDTQEAYPHDRCIHELFEAQVERTPDAIALQCGDARLSYAELNARSNRLAHRLRAL
ncbi:MAG: Non-ribosomal peptide synthetase component, partial [Betaproteobacteria bacterium]|nr:Non-ribosomal peptide synthetase component [Betaproteobacteria bacterium]